MARLKLVKEHIERSINNLIWLELMFHQLELGSALQAFSLSYLSPTWLDNPKARLFSDRLVVSLNKLSFLLKLCMFIWALELGVRFFVIKSSFRLFFNNLLICCASRDTCTNVDNTVSWMWDDFWQESLLCLMKLIHSSLSWISCVLFACLTDM